MTYKRFYKLFNRLPLHDDEMKERLVQQYTNGRTSSLRAMSTAEYDALCDALDAQSGTHAVNVTHSPVTGNHGTHEFFLHVRFGEGSFAPVEDAAIRAAVERALTLPKYRK